MCDFDFSNSRFIIFHTMSEQPVKLLELLDFAHYNVFRRTIIFFVLNCMICVSQTTIGLDIKITYQL